MWWNNVLKVFIHRASPAKMFQRVGGVHSDWVDAEGNAKTNGDWIYKPDVSAVVGVEPKYWNGTTVVTEMSQAEKDAVDAAILADRIGNIKTGMKEEFDDPVAMTKAVLLTVLAMNNRLTSKINALEAGMEQLKTELKNQALNNALTYDFSTQTPSITPAQARDYFRAEVDKL